MNKNSSSVETEASSNSLDENDMPENKSPRIIAITSGKGGVGKTNISLNLAIALSKLNKRVCIFDADLGMANINILLGINPEFDIQHVISGEKEIKDIIVCPLEGIQIIPGSSGIQQLAELKTEHIDRLITGFEQLVEGFDFFFIDTSAGISKSVLSFVMAAHESIVVVTREPTSLTDGYSLIKTITGMGHKKKIHIMVNMVPTLGLAKKIFQKLSEAAQKHLKIELNHLGTIINDPNLIEAVCQQKPVLVLYPTSSSSKKFTSLANKICDLPHSKTEAQEESINSFWNRTLKILKAPLEINKKENTSIQELSTAKEGSASQEVTPSQEKQSVDRTKDSDKNKVQIALNKISDMIRNKNFDAKAFLGFNETEKSYIEQLDLFLNKYYQFLELTFIAGKDKYFIELDFDDCLQESVETSKLGVEDMANPFINAATSVLKQMANMDVITRKTVIKKSIAYGDITGISKLSGKNDILIAIGFSKECAQFIVSGLFNEELSFLNEEGSLHLAIKDGIGEITNVIVGKARQELSTKGYDFKASIPEVITSKNYGLENKVMDSYLIIPFLSNKGFISLSIGFINSEFALEDL